MQTVREVVEDRVRRRARHENAEDVRDTLSFARVERLLGREYAGRFLIELLQNAADAARVSGRRARAHVLLADGDVPALVVANEGAPFPVSVVLNTLGHVGASTKEEGAAIGHKGIGFKSVLEVTRTPELYSGLQAGPGQQVAVRFDPDAALRLIAAESRGWPALLAEAQEGAAEIASGDAVVPVLRFPTWLAQRPPVVDELAAAGYDTAVVLPCPHADATQQEEWLSEVRRRFADVTDEILLLLGTFSTVTLEDRLHDERTEVTAVVQHTETLASGVTVEDVVVRRGPTATSRWLLHRSSTADAGLADDLAAALRLDLNHDDVLAVRPSGPAPESPFHLFFPTGISSGLPFLLHGYFEVDAGRTGFYRGSSERNDRVLLALAALTAAAVEHVVADPRTDLVRLAETLAAARPPDDAQAGAFRHRVLCALDEVPWVPAAGAARAGRPAELLCADGGQLDRHLRATFPAPYVRARTGLLLPPPDLSAQARALLRDRAGSEAADVWRVLPDLLRPGPDGPWGADRAAVEAGFLALIDLGTALEAADRKRAAELFADLRSRPDSHLVPVVTGAGDVRLLPVPDPAPGRRGTVVLSRVRRTVSADLVPPAALDVEFLRDGLLTDEAHVARAQWLGVRPFVVDTVLDRLERPGSSLPDEDAQEPDPEEHRALVTFLWRLLGRGRVHDFATVSVAEHHVLGGFSPGALFWLQPGRGAEGSDNEVAKQRRERLLSGVRLPAQDGSWQPAGALALGADWAGALELEGHTDEIGAARTAAYRRLERTAPRRSALLASPHVLAELLPPLDEDRRGTSGAEPDERVTLLVRRLAFVLRLGAWESVPLLAHEQRTSLAGARGRFPWPEVREALAPDLADEPWNFGRWQGRRHHRTVVSEDVRLAWPCDDLAPDRRADLAALLDQGLPLWQRWASASAVCFGCRDSGTEHVKAYRTTTADERRPSTLALQLARGRWLPVRRGGVDVLDGGAPRDTWWAENVPTGGALLSSPLRLLTVVAPGLALSPAFRDVVGLTDVEHSSARRLWQLLTSLAATLEDGAPATPAGQSSAGLRAAFLALHRVVYERLARLDDGPALLSQIGVLCEVGDRLELRAPAEARHDDSRYALYRQLFSTRLPFVIIARDRRPTAEALGIPAFAVDVVRRGREVDGVDVTEQVAHLTVERSAELLAITVHHPLGTATLDPSSPEFETRSRRLRGMRVVQLEDLVLDVRVPGTDLVDVLGRDRAGDVLLEGATTAQPVLFHDFSGEGWVDALRRRLARQLAVILENPSYAATFTLLLQADTDAEQEAVLHDLGVSMTQVDELRERLGVVSADGLARQERWYRAVVGLLASGAAWPSTRWRPLPTATSSPIATRPTSTSRMPSSR